MSSVKIILNDKLTNKEHSKFIKLENQTYLDLNNNENHYSEYEKNDQKGKE